MLVRNKWVLTVVAFFFTIVLSSVHHVSAGTFGDFQYSVNSDGTVKITAYLGDDTDVGIPSMMDDKLVTAIGTHAFFNLKEELTNIKLNEGLKIIGIGAFEDNHLTNVTLPSTVERIENNALLIIISVL